MLPGSPQFGNVVPGTELDLFKYFLQKGLIQLTQVTKQLTALYK